MLTLTVAKPQKIFWYEDDKLTKHFEHRLKTAIQNVQKHVTKIIIINVNHSRNTQRSVFQCYQGISRIIWRSAEVVVECWYFQQHCCFGLSSDCKNSPTAGYQMSKVFIEQSKENPTCLSKLLVCPLGEILLSFELSDNWKQMAKDILLDRIVPQKVTYIIKCFHY